MKASLVVIIAVAVLLMIGGVYYFSQNPYRPNSEVDEGDNPPENNNPDNDLPESNSGPTSEIGVTHNVEIKSFVFSPSPLTINIGDTVIWTNEDSTPHTVTSDSGSELDSVTFREGETYSHTFDEAGTFDYHCAIHPNMKGEIVVE